MLYRKKTKHAHTSKSKTMSEKEEEQKTLTFKEDERMRYGAMNYDNTELMAVISGFDLNIAFNMRTINSLADAEAAANALADVFYELLMEQLLQEKAHLVKPFEPQTTTL